MLVSRTSVATSTRLLIYDSERNEEANKEGETRWSHLALPF